MHEFKTAAKDKRKPRETFAFKLDDVELTSIRPSESLVVMLMVAQASEIRSDESRMAGLIDASLALFDEDSRRHLSRQLLDPEDPFEFDTDDDETDMMTIVSTVIEEWSDRPTKPSSGSTSSSVESGDGSTESASPKELASSISQ